MAKKAAARTGSIDTELRYLDIEDLRFDPHNPRIAEQLPPKATQDDIQALLLSGAFNAKELVPSFAENGYLPYEPVIVRQPVNGKYEVLEGNRRLAALRSMRDSKDPEISRAFRAKSLHEVPCLVFDGDAVDELAYLGLRHLSKTKDWSTNAKAAFVERFLKNGKNLTEAAKITNTTSTALRTLLLTRRLFERAQQLGFSVPNSDAEGEIVFWHLGDAVRRAKTKQFLQIEENSNPLKQPDVDEGKLEQLVGWLYGNNKTMTQKVISSIRDIPNLDRVLGNERAINVLESGGSLEDALEELQTAGENVTLHLDRASRSVSRALSTISSLDADGVNQAKLALSRLERSIDSLRTLLESDSKGGKKRRGN